MNYKIINLIIDLIYPRRCPVCDEIVTNRQAGVCLKCEAKIEFVKEPYCFKCGKPLDKEVEYCQDCSERQHFYDEGRAVIVYNENFKQSMYRFKYNSRQEYAKFYAKIMYDTLKNKFTVWNPQVIVPVPVHKDKLRKRGYNQAYLIAKELSKYLGIPVDDELIKRRKSTEVQKNLSAKERENNIKKAFIVTRNSVELSTVLIVDDIYTTGSTIDAISLCLKRAGVKKLYFATVCIGRGY